MQLSILKGLHVSEVVLPVSARRRMSVVLCAPVQVQRKGSPNLNAPVRSAPVRPRLAHSESRSFRGGAFNRSSSTNTAVARDCSALWMNPAAQCHPEVRAQYTVYGRAEERR